MNQLNEWSQLISKYLKSESESVGAQAKHDLYHDPAKEIFTRIVLEPFLPHSLGIGSGRVIDAHGNKSKYQDIIIYQRDYPQLNLIGGSDIFLYESVLATIQVETKLIRKTLFDALDQCASMADLNPVVNQAAISKIAAKNNFILNEQGEYGHIDPLLNARFNLIGRPLGFIYAFSGHQTNPKQLEGSIHTWIEHRRDHHLPVDIKYCAATIATQGCFATRNAAPFALNQNFLFGIGSDDAPIRLIIMQLMHALNRRLRKHNDGLGIRYDLDAYLDSMPLPEMTSHIGEIYDENQAVTILGLPPEEDEPASVDAVEAPEVPDVDLNFGIDAVPLEEQVIDVQEIDIQGNEVVDNESYSIEQQLDNLGEIETLEVTDLVEDPHAIIQAMDISKAKSDIDNSPKPTLQ